MSAAASVEIISFIERGNNCTTVLPVFGRFSIQKWRIASSAKRQWRGVELACASALADQDRANDKSVAGSARNPKMTMSCTKWIVKAQLNPRVSIMLLARIHPKIPAINTVAHPEGWPK